MTREQLKQAFNEVKNQTDWKAEIMAIIAPDDFDDINEAVIHFTGEPIEVIEVFKAYPEDLLKIYSPGYRADERRI